MPTPNANNEQPLPLVFGSGDCQRHAQELVAMVEVVLEVFQPGIRSATIGSLCEPARNRARYRIARISKLVREDIK